MYKSGFVTVIGRPNVGKSTLLNSILGQKMTITSNKAQTTRNKISLIHSEDRGQIVFIDTPGIQKPRNELGKFMLGESLSSLEGIDIVIMMVEPDEKIGKKDRNILERIRGLKGTHPLFLVINKVDSLNKDQVLPVIGRYAEEEIFDEIIPLSARTGDNVDRLLDLIYDRLEEGPKYYPEDMLTDQPERFVIAELIREKGLSYLQEEVPHGLAVEINSMKERQDKALYDIDATIYVERDSHKGIIIGKGGAMLKRIGMEARRDIENLLGQKVNLQLWVKVSKNWRDKDERVKHFGYQAES
ncbi:MAG: GTPase Era [Tissierellia bacterium]|nr:GTPase Era [Tissierellia bacterium]